jgi:hypothetical protein
MYLGGAWTVTSSPLSKPRGDEIVEIVYGPKGGTSKANACLIAAAPDLYEALRDLSFHAQTTGGTAGRDEALCAAIDRATAALARARGEAA